MLRQGQVLLLLLLLLLLLHIAAGHAAESIADQSCATAFACSYSLFFLLGLFRTITEEHRYYAGDATRRMSHATRHTSHVTRHTSHVTLHTSHVTHHTSPRSSQWFGIDFLRSVCDSRIVIVVVSSSSSSFISFSIIISISISISISVSRDDTVVRWLFCEKRSRACNAAAIDPAQVTCQC